jgi:hypothetical protein
VLITDGTGMTVVNKFQRILGLKVPENLKDFINVPADKKQTCFLYLTWNTIQTSWLETIADVAYSCY